MKCAECGQFGHEEPCTAKPQSRIGVDGGGIRGLDDVMDRCRIDEDTGCWNWALSISTSRRGSVLPVAWWPEAGAVRSVLRIAWKYGRGQEIGSRIVWRKCANDLCCNPDHLMAGSRKVWAEWCVRNGIRKSAQSTHSRRQNRIARGDTKLTMELAQWIRESEQTGVAMSHALDVSVTQISRARLGKIWAPIKSSSVFAWRP